MLTGREAAALDRFAIDTLNIPSLVLIEAAGRAAAAVTQHLGPDGPVAVVAGKGNNGADAMVVARTLASWGREVTLVPIAEGLNDELLHGWDVPIVPLSEAERVLFSATVVVDGILGTGLRGSPRGAQLDAIRVVGLSPGLKVALDMPAGVNADTGAVEGEAVQADVTIGFGSAKLGAVMFPGRARVGRHIVVDIGFPPRSGVATLLVTPAWSSARLPRRSPDAHKNSVGPVAVVAGRKGMAGAATLASRAAMRAGAGYVRIITDGGNRDIVQSSLPEAVFVDRGDPKAVTEALDASRAVLMGPGIGSDADGARILDHVLNAVNPATPMVVDADALTLLAMSDASSRPPRLSALSVLLTPHLGEMARLTQTAASELKSDPLGAARALAEHNGVSVLLKGAPTVVVQPSGDAWIAASQSSDLAVAGMGDTLAGTIVGLVAQGLPLAEAGATALEVTARAAQLAGGGLGLIPSDVADHLSTAVMERGSGHTDLPFPFVLFDQDAPR